MSNFVVSARKYRPTRFKDVVGQSHVTNVLKNALDSNKIAQAFLFTGPRGVGKTTCARILAKTLNCQNLSEDKEPCNTCGSCEAFNQNASFNITELDAASHNGVDHIRSLIEQVRFQPQQGKYKIFIIDEVHMLSIGAFNAFLKTLEEPPPYAVFILATTEKHKIIPTILSRCQIFDFKRIQTKDTAVFLKEICAKEKLEAEEEALHLIAQKADGALRDALSIFDRLASIATNGKITYDLVSENLNVLDYDYYFNIVDHFLLGNTSDILLTFGEVVEKGFEPDIFLYGLSEHIRNLLVARKVETHKLLELSENLKLRYVDQAKKSSKSFLLNALSLLNDCDINYKQARNKRLHVEMCLLKATHIEHMMKLSTEKKTKPTSNTPQQISFNEPSVTKPPQSSASETEKESIVEVVVENAKEDWKKDSTPAAEEVFSPKVEEENTTSYEVQNAKANGEDIPPKVEESIQEKKEVNLLSGSSSINIPTISIHDMETAIKKEDEEKDNEVVPELTLESLKEVWTAYAMNVKSAALKNTLTSLELSISNGQIVAKVGSKLGEGYLREDTGLMLHLRNHFKNPSLKRVIDVDTEKLQVLIEKERSLNPKEIFDKFSEKNPNIKKLTKALDLSPDRM